MRATSGAKIPSTSPFNINSVHSRTSSAWKAARQREDEEDDMSPSLNRCPEQAGGEPLHLAPRQNGGMI
jgi:hypothetical protein